MPAPFENRREAGRELGSLLGSYRNRDDLLVLGLPRGGVPVAAEVAATLHAPLDVFLVRKIGVPGREELAMGAIASGGVRVLSREVLADYRISSDEIAAVERREQAELDRREHLYRGNEPPVELAGRTVIVVDDGLATGSTMRAAVEAIRQRNPARVIVAVPVGSAATCAALREVADEVVCAATPEPFYAVGLWYRDFSPTSDDEVRELLRRSTRQPDSTTATPSNAHSAGGRSMQTIAPVDAVRAAAHPIADVETDLAPLVQLAGGGRFALIGEASHGTHEFYVLRAELTKRLITEHGYSAVAVEADWPDAGRVNAYVCGHSSDPDAEAALGGFRRFPQWMWRNTVVVEFVEWLRAHNDALPTGRSKVGFYGLDLYSLGASIGAVIAYLDKVDPEAAARARHRYSCLEQFGNDPQAYGYATSLGGAEPCEDEVVAQLVELQRRASELAGQDGRVAEDQHFFAEQNARLARNAEAYYRSMFRGRASSWNLRDCHMGETLEALVGHLERAGERAKVAVWAHNSHLGDARATEMGAGGELNLGQLVRERAGRDATLIGFSTYHGTVSAATNWDAPVERKRVRPGLPGSYEALFHEVGMPAFWLDLRAETEAIEALRTPRLQRAIGVIYRPETERLSHYVEARLPDQFDAIIHLDETTALEPLERTPGWTTGEPPETYPSGI